ncbi:putative methyltransferase-domain-containing protein [Diplogelasinospora grovesii]|uniref:Methyltransferase-domain-containing protein n=1 Tax=Diplogelasinospora grovesii TaxID=303347 RepID=A0AAN6S9S9_9PEZI|nr:putative methyltransferase-domain-containing protein [Diplogelasinospora grovesii]
MHYVRLLRPPATEQSRSHGQTLKLVLTIATDLGDSYLSPLAPIELSVLGASTKVDENGVSTTVPVNLTPQVGRPRWQAGMRVLKLDVPLPPQQQQQPISAIQIRPADGKLLALRTADVCADCKDGGKGLIVPVYVDMPPQDGSDARYLSFRSLRLPLTIEGNASVSYPVLQVEEEIGEARNLARHIWDGGLVAMSLIAEIGLAGNSVSGSALPILSGILRQSDGLPLNILELGCGVGILGIGITHVLGLLRPADNDSATDMPRPHVLMTDLPDAEERVRANIGRYLSSRTDERQRQQPLVDYENLDWGDGKNGTFGPNVHCHSWNLIVLSDCTYNVDTLPALVKTLSALHSHSASQAHVDGGKSCDTKILLATKPRHSSEKAAWKLMAADGWSVQEKVVLPLPVLHAEGQSVEVYLFSKV